MRIFKTKWFARFARKENIPDARLIEAVRLAEDNKIDSVLGGGLIKQRIPRDGGGKSGGYRSIIAYKAGDKCFFLFCFAKNDKENLEEDELRVFKNLSRSLLSHGDSGVEDLLKVGEIVEVIQ